LIEDVRKRRKVGASSAELATCPDCQGTGKVRKELPYKANPKAPATSAERLGWRPCPKCHGTGQVGLG